MNLLRSLFCAILLLPALAAGADSPWTSFPVPSDSEIEAVRKLGEAGIEVLAWSNATVEVSAFEELEQIPLAELSERLTPQDPRWDPWLKDIGEWFRPGRKVSLLWVPAEKKEEAGQLLGASEVSSTREAAASPRSVTGWGLIAFTLLFAVLHLVASRREGWPQWQEYRRWLWAPTSALLLIAGTLLVGGLPGRTKGPEPLPSVSWLQHRWFQESWPWGATWKDYAPGKAWVFPAYEHKDGRLAEVPSQLRAADAAWETTVRAEMKPGNAARIFGSAIP